MLTGIRSSLDTAFRWIDERQQRRALRELWHLDDRMLTTIGLNRSEIERVAQDDSLGRRRGKRRALIARSSHGIMAPEPLMARRSLCPLLAVLILLGALLSAGLVVVAAT
jgi:uncharacterized protein YjiS (DUF1127 family)